MSPVYVTRSITGVLFALMLTALVGCAGTAATPVAVATNPSATTVPAEPTTAPATETTNTADATSEPAKPTATTEAVATAEATTEATVEATATTEEIATAEPTAIAAACAKLNLNEVSADQLLSTIPNFSDRMTREFAEYKPYISIQQFRREIGKYVDEAQVTEWEQYVYVPVDPNEADSETLQQLPGITEDIATQLTDARPYASTQAFVDQLGTLVSADDAAQASCYLATGS